MEVEEGSGAERG